MERRKETAIAKIVCATALWWGACALEEATVYAADDEATKSIALTLEGACDPKNSRLFVSSSHQTRTIVATLRWNLSGSKRVVTDNFQIAPGARIEVGCAAQADVVSAEFVQ